jgi:hypothetical protein
MQRQRVIYQTCALSTLCCLSRQSKFWPHDPDGPDIPDLLSIKRRRRECGAASLLKPGGVMGFSVPYSLDAVAAERFPELHEFTVQE